MKGLAFQFQANLMQGIPVRCTCLVDGEEFCHHPKALFDNPEDDHIFESLVRTAPWAVYDFQEFGSKKMQFDEA